MNMDNEMKRPPICNPKKEKFPFGNIKPQKIGLDDDSDSLPSFLQKPIKKMKANRNSSLKSPKKLFNTNKFQNNKDEYLPKPLFKAKLIEFPEKGPQPFSNQEVLQAKYIQDLVNAQKCEKIMSDEISEDNNSNSSTADISEYSKEKNTYNSLKLSMFNNNNLQVQSPFKFE